MRSILILFGTIVVLAGGFLAYFSLQSKPPPHTRDSARLSLPVELPPTTRRADDPLVGEGEDVWIVTPDEKTGQVAFQFRASRYDPQPDRSVRVENPEAELFMGKENRRVVRIEGIRGRVVMSGDLPQGGKFRGREASAPRRGELYDVTISVFNESDLAHAILVCKVNNIAFDNDTFRIATEGYTDGSREVPADQVPVEVRGDDFDFDGRGLTIRWNEADRRLQLLEIAHGESLTIKSPQMLQALDRAGSARRERSEEPRVRLASSMDGPTELPTTVGSAIAADAQPDSQVYRATFHESVRVAQAGGEIASADQMFVDFINDGKEASGAGRGSAPGASKNSTTAGVDNQARHPSTQPVQPVVIRWAGKLRVSALEGDAPRPAPGSLNIAMSGEKRPVVLDHNGVKVICASFDYRSGDDSLSVTSSKAVPMITLQTPEGMIVRTPSVLYRGEEAQAVMRGAGSAKMQVQGEPDEDPQTVDATWNRSCVLTLPRDRQGQWTIEQALLDGDVIVVADPRLRLRSDSLKLALGSGSRRQTLELKEVSAAGSVRCRITDDDGKIQTIDCEQLALTLAPSEQGAMVPRILQADGSVLAQGDDNELRAGHLTVWLIPVAGEGAAAPPGDAMFGRGDFQLDKLTALQDVRLKLPDGVTASANQLDLQRTDEGMVSKFLGQPATIADQANSLSGPVITLVNESQRLSVIGPGKLQFDARQSRDEASQPVQVFWDSGLSADGRENRAEFAGNVKMLSESTDGSRQIASANRALVTLMDAPRSSSQPIVVPAEDSSNVKPFELTSAKTLQSVTLDGDAQVQWLGQGQDQSQFRRLHLLAPKVTYDLLARRGEVPSAGRMLLQDTLPDSKPHAPNRVLGGFRGATAFQWDKDLIMNLADNQIVMSGNVLIVHQEPKADAPMSRMEASVVRLDLLPQQIDAATQPAEAAGLLGTSDIKLKGMSAEGDVRMRLPDVQMDAQSIAYDAVHELLTARGSDRVPVQLYNEQGVSRGAFQEVIWNTRTDQLQMRGVQAQVRR